MTLLTINDYTDSLKKHINKVQDLPQYTVLLSPSPAQLRNYCIGLCKEDLSPDDKIILKDFFRGDSTELNDIVKSINRFELGWFKPIQSFLGKKTDTSKNHAVLEMVALMYDYELRPYGKFRKSSVDIEEEIIADEQTDSIIVEEKREAVEEKTIEDHIPPVQSFAESLPTTTAKNKLKRNLLIVTVIIIGLLGVGSLVSSMLSNDECMKWEGDRYVAYDCGEATIKSFAGVSNEPVPYDKSILKNFKQISVDCDTEFFRKGKPKVWFVKTGEGKHDYFNNPGTGVHPISGKSLRPITQYHLNKYIYSKCK
ncbi:hypothetical protein HX057_03725 [Myroides odoratimimus]|uniref:Uncharacterized protein n=1 Tax=Myroides odoratimimus TaxID=76832 RepID=A0AAI8C553_9FLAO|nr:MULTISPECIES: hypothetical protein [Myroides]ALU26175.1 hypothetical protein AS202_08430 [Myroides odoratimimus]APA92217.1 hypothetical protein BK054_08260 [Myroides sp. ZB35]MCO7722554.1 hypothetical protein [Myroides odoratimimus]MCS7471745.1 hypothetical protein [Myroides odoratimimus]MDM1032874.1 hypothetical protein [Myroides odoratimimus]